MKKEIVYMIKQYASKEFITNESHICINPNNKSKIIKIIKKFKNEPDFFQMKMRTINLLLENIDVLSKLNVALPEEIVSIDGLECGYQARKINGLSLETLLASKKISLDRKTDYLKQVGSILRKMKEIRTNTSVKDLFYVDIHEGNFMVEKDIVYGIDSDSFSILDNIATSGYYSGELYELCPNSKKYQFRDISTDSETDVIPDENLDIYSYTRMILNFMAGYEIEDLTKDKLSDYLTYLELRGANLDLLYALESIYDESRENINPDYLLDYIKEMYKYSSINYDDKGILKRILKY
jgi:hypothetical protein